MWCKFCELARLLGGNLCRPCWRKAHFNKKR